MKFVAYLRMPAGKCWYPLDADNIDMAIKEAQEKARELFDYMEKCKSNKDIFVKIEDVKHFDANDIYNYIKNETVISKDLFLQLLKKENLI